MNTFVINGKEYKARAFDFNLLCELEDMGIALQEAAGKPMSMVRAYFAACGEMSREAAGKELEAHIAKGESLEAVMKVMSVEMERSDFFHSLTRTGAVRNEGK